jgi:hypothetical protein
VYKDNLFLIKLKKNKKERKKFVVPDMPADEQFRSGIG